MVRESTLAERPRVLPLGNDRQSGLHARRRKHFSVAARTPVNLYTPVATDVGVQITDLIVSSPKGISALKLTEMSGVYDVTACHPGYRIRATTAAANLVLSGAVEVDDTYRSRGGRLPMMV